MTLTTTFRAAAPLTFSLAMGAALLVAGGVQAEQTLGKTYDIKDVTELEVYGGARLELVQGDKESLHAEAKADVIDRLDVDLTGHKLRLGVKNKSGNGFHFFNWFNQNIDNVTYHIQLKNLNALELSGASHATLSDWNGKSMVVHVSGAGDITFANLRVDDFWLELSGASNGRVQQLVNAKTKVELSGAANMDINAASSSKSLMVDASGASNFRGKLLTVAQAEVGASGASNIELQVTEFLKAGASGASNVHYLGQAKVERETSGASHVEPLKN